LVDRNEKEAKKVKGKRGSEESEGEEKSEEKSEEKKKKQLTTRDDCERNGDCSLRIWSLVECIQHFVHRSL